MPKSWGKVCLLGAALLALWPGSRALGKDKGSVVAGAGYGRMLASSGMDDFFDDGHIIRFHLGYEVQKKWQVKLPIIPDHYGFAEPLQGTGSLQTIHWNVFSVPVPILHLSLGANLYTLELHSPKDNIQNYKDVFFRPTLTSGAELPLPLGKRAYLELSYLYHWSFVDTKSILSASRVEKINIGYHDLGATLVYRF